MKSKNTTLHWNSLENIDNGVRYQLQSAQRKFQTIYPSHRTKRGLINGLGNIIKAISGNLDQSDAERYDRAIESLQNNEKNIISKFNQQISLTTHLIDNFNKTITSLTNNQKLIAKEVEKLNMVLDNLVFEFDKFIQIQNTLNQLNLSLQLIIQLLTDLENAISFARISTLHNSVIKVGEIKSIVHIMLQHYKKNQLLYIDEENLLKYYDIISTDAYFSNYMVVFILHFPILHSEPFTHYHLYSIPTKNLTTIIPTSPYLIIGTELFQYSKTACKKLDTTYLCQKVNLQFHSKSPDCISQILRISDEEARCLYVPVLSQNTLIEAITSSHYIGIFPLPTKVSTHCSTSNIQVIHGVYLFEVPLGCEFHTPEESYYNAKEITYEEPLTLPNIQIVANYLPAKPKAINLEKIHLDELQRIHEEQQLLQPMSYEENPPDATHFWTTPVFIVITICIGTIIYRYRHRFQSLKIKKKKEEEETSSPQQEDHSVLFVPYKTSPRDGQVTL